MEQAEEADFYILVYVWVRVPPVGWGPTDEVQIVCVGESPNCGLQSHRQRTTGWFPALITLVGSRQGAPSFTGPFWKHAGWCLNRHPQGVG